MWPPVHAPMNYRDTVAIVRTAIWVIPVRLNRRVTQNLVKTRANVRIRERFPRGVFTCARALSVMSRPAGRRSESSILIALIIGMCFAGGVRWDGASARDIDPDACLNLDAILGFSCECTQGFTGLTCKKLDP